MASVRDTEIARLTEELDICEAAIKRVLQNGQSWRKGGSMGFGNEQAKLSQLRAERSELRAKLSTWGIYEA
jgi:hypothetical protein